MTNQVPIADSAADSATATTTVTDSGSRKRVLEDTQANNTKTKVHKKKQRKAAQKMHIELAKASMTVPALRDLIEAVLINKQAKWHTLTKIEQLKQVVVVFVPGLVYSDVVAGETSCQRTARVTDIESTEEFKTCEDDFQVVFPLVLPGTKTSVFPPFHTLTHERRTKSECRRIQELGANCTLKDLCLSPKQLQDQKYPVALSEDQICNGWYQTKSNTLAGDGKKIYALDCEFCVSEVGYELTRVSIVDGESKIVLDTYVQPPNAIIDFKTQYSGIKPEHLEGVTTTLADVQQQILSTVGCDDILIGHSLINDLEMLRIVHTNIIDTAVVYEHPRGPPFRASLKWLTEKYLHREIQTSDIEGHCSVEDSRACLDLVKLKLVHGYYFGTTITDAPLQERLLDQRHIHMKVIQNAAFPDSSCDDDEAYRTASKAIGPESQWKVVVLQLPDMETIKARNETNKTVFTQIHSLYDSAEDGTLMMLFGSRSDLLKLVALQQLRRQLTRSDKETNGEEHQWTQAKEQELHEAAQEARDSFVAMGLKGYDISVVAEQ